MPLTQRNFAERRQANDSAAIVPTKHTHGPAGMA